MIEMLFVWFSVHGDYPARGRHQLLLLLLLRCCRARLGRLPNPMPRWPGNILAAILTWLGPKGLAFANYSLAYHVIRCVRAGFSTAGGAA